MTYSLYAVVQNRISQHILMSTEVSPNFLILFDEIVGKSICKL